MIVIILCISHIYPFWCFIMKHIYIFSSYHPSNFLIYTISVHSFLKNFPAKVYYNFNKNLKFFINCIVFNNSHGRVHSFIFMVNSQWLSIPGWIFNYFGGRFCYKSRIRGLNVGRYLRSILQYSIMNKIVRNIVYPFNVLFGPKVEQVVLFFVVFLRSPEFWYFFVGPYKKNHWIIRK